MSLEGKSRKQTISVLVLIIAVVAIFGAYHFAIESYIAEWGRKPTDVSEQPPPVNTVDSASCVACHTNPSIISVSTVGQDKAPAEDAGG